jgi:hypothetical protein
LPSAKFSKIPAKFIHFTHGIAAAKGPTVNFLSRTKPGRVLLHALCVLRRPRHVSWHWHGIVREFAH